MAEFRAGNWAVAERALEAACETLAQFELRGPLTASFADRSVIDAHRGRIDRGSRHARRPPRCPGRLDVIWRMVCHSAQGAVEFCAGTRRRRSGVVGDARGGSRRQLDRQPGGPK